MVCWSIQTVRAIQYLTERVDLWDLYRVIQNKILWASYLNGV